MTVQRPDGQRPLSTTDIATYMGCLVVGLALTHLTIVVLDDGMVTATGGFLLAAVAIFIAGFMYVRRAAIAQRRHAFYVLHVMAFLLVNSSFWLHALLAHSSTTSDDIIVSWRGALLTMPLVWSVGLLLHTIGTAFAKGYEHVDV